MNNSSPVASADRIPLAQKLGFSAGVNMQYVATDLMTGVLWMPFFNIGLGMSPVILGVVLMILRAWDAITDPVMGNLSDNTRTRWGRRRPYLFVGALLTAALYPFFWHMPVGLGETGRAVYLTIVGMAFFTVFTIWSMPYYALQMELTPSYDERTRLAAWMALLGKLSSLAGSWLLALMVWLGTLALQPGMDSGAPESGPTMLGKVVEFLARPMSDEKPLVVGMRAGAWLVAAMIAVFGLMPALFVRERYYEAAAGGQARDGFWKGIRESARCAPLWNLILISFFLVLGTASISGLGQYVNIYYVHDGDLARASVVAGWKGTAVVVAGICSLPLFTWLGERWDKRRVVLLMLGCSMGGHLLNLVCMTPAHPHWQIVSGVFESCALAAVWMFLPSMKADVADYDELQTGRRREGSLNAFFSWFIKAALTCSMGLGGLVLHFSGFDAALPRQSRDVLDNMFGLYLLLALVIWAGAFAAAWFFPLTRERCLGIRNELEARRGRV